MEKSRNHDAVLVTAIILLAVGCVSIGYALCSIVNNLDGGIPLAGVGAMASSLSAIFFARSRTKAG